MMRLMNANYHTDYCHPVQKLICYVFHSTEILHYIKFLILLIMHVLNSMQNYQRSILIIIYM